VPTQLRTLGALEALQNDPEGYEVIKKFFKLVTVERDLNTYYRWLFDHQVNTTVTSNLNRDKSRAAGIHPSSACKKGVCLLKVYYECTHEMKPNRGFDQKMAVTWDTGTMLHDMMQTHFKAMYGDQFESEVSLCKDRITSHTDGVFDFSNYRFILEMKSIKEGGNYGWEKIQAAPLEDNVRQAHFYMWLADIPFALVLYIGKNIGEFKEHAIEFNHLIWDDIWNNVINPVVAAAYEKGPMVQASSGWHCRWCDFAYACPHKNSSRGKGEAEHVAIPWEDR